MTRRKFRIAEVLAVVAKLKQPFRVWYVSDELGWAWHISVGMWSQSAYTAGYPGVSIGVYKSGTVNFEQLQGGVSGLNKRMEVTSLVVLLRECRAWLGKDRGER